MLCCAAAIRFPVRGSCDLRLILQKRSNGGFCVKLRARCRIAASPLSALLSGPRHLGSPGPEPPLCCFPNLIEDSSGDLGLVLGQEPPVVLGEHLCGVLDGIAGLLVGAGLLQDMRRKHIADIVRTVREKALDRALPSPGVIDAVALDAVRQAS